MAMKCRLALCLHKERMWGRNAALFYVFRSHLSNQNFHSKVFGFEDIVTHVFVLRLSKCNNYLSKKKKAHMGFRCHG